MLPVTVKAVLDWLAANPLFLTFVLLVALGLATALVKGRAVDRCLKCFRGYPVRIEFSDGAVVEGTLRVGREVVEAEFDSPRRTASGHEATSRLVYESEFDDIKAFVRRLDVLTKRQERHRRRALARVTRPSLMRRLTRRLANVGRSIQDAIQDAAGLWMGRARSGSAVLSGATSGIDRAKKELAGVIFTRYEALLEELRGRRVVVELTIDRDRSETFVGTLREYSQEFLEIWDVEYPLGVKAPVLKKGQAPEPAEDDGPSDIAATESELGVRVKNASAKALRIDAIRAGSKTEALGGAIVGPGEVIEVSVKGSTEDAVLECFSPTPCDLILPRKAATIRHRAAE